MLFANTTKFSLYENLHRMDFQIFTKFSINFIIVFFALFYQDFSYKCMNNEKWPPARILFWKPWNGNLIINFAWPKRQDMAFCHSLIVKKQCSLWYSTYSTHSKRWFCLVSRSQTAFFPICVGAGKNKKHKIAKIWSYAQIPQWIIQAGILSQIIAKCGVVGFRREKV